MKRPVAVIVLAWSVLVAGCASVAAEETPAAPGEAGPAQPNIIFILTDDLGYGDVGAYGAQMIKTPALDRMAAEGVRLTSFYSPANVCTPARASFLTGRHAIRMGLAEGVIHPPSTHGLPQDEETLAELLGAQGYRTHMIGKWHLGHQPDFWPTAHGFESFFGVPYSNDMTPFPLYQGMEKIEEPAKQATLTRRYTEQAVAIIEAEDERPFFLYLAHTFPHIPLFASEDFLGQSEAGLYGDTVEEIDWSTGEILAALERTGQAGNTLVVFTSDNGPWFEGSSGPARERKGATWEGAYRVPFLAWWPGALPAGTVSDAPVSGLDLLPTFAALAGAEPSAELDGADIWPVLSDNADSPHEQLLFFNEDQIAAIRVGDWRLVVESYYRIYSVPLEQFGYPLLFDLSRDPGESYSLAQAHEAVVADLLARIEAAREALGVPERPQFSVE